MQITPTTNGIAIEQRDVEGNLFKRLYNGYTVKQAKESFKTAIEYHNRKLKELTFINKTS